MKNTYIDTLFDEINDYNKDIIAYKKSFFQNVSTNDLKNLLDTLTFNTNFNSTNYRWGKRFFNKDLNKLSWISDTDKQIKKIFWDKNERVQKSYMKNIYFTNEMINEHFLSCYKPSRKIGFYYHLSDIMKEKYNDYLIALENLYRINSKTYGLSQKLNTNILLIDIDNYDDRHAINELNKLLTFLNIKINDLIYVEQNPFTGGIHTAIKLPFTVVDERFYSFLMSYLKDNDIHIECNFVNNLFRLPLSFEYVAIQKNKDVLNYEEFIPEKYWEPSFVSYKNNLYLHACSNKQVNDLYKLFFKSLNASKWDNYWKTKKNYFSRVKENSNNLKKFNLYELKSGDRYNKMSKMIPLLKGLGYSLSETADIIMKQNKGSNDLTKWGQGRLMTNISNFYSKCHLNIIDCSNYNGFISNIHNLPKETLEFLSSYKFQQFITNRFINAYINERNKHDEYFTKLSNEKKQILEREIPLFVQEIIGYMFYNINNPIISTIDVETGFQLSDIHLSKIQDHIIQKLNLDKDYSLNKTSLQYLKKALIKSLSLTEIKYKNRKRNWMLGSCRSYSIKCLNDLMNMLQHLYNSCYQINYYNNYISNKSSNILYISLIENPTFFENAKTMSKNKDSP